MYGFLTEPSTGNVERLNGGIINVENFTDVSGKRAYLESDRTISAEGAHSETAIFIGYFNADTEIGLAISDAYSSEILEAYATKEYVDELIEGNDEISEGVFSSLEILNEEDFVENPKNAPILSNEGVNTLDIEVFESEAEGCTGINIYLKIDYLARLITAKYTYVSEIGETIATEEVVSAELTTIDSVFDTSGFFLKWKSVANATAVHNWDSENLYNKTEPERDDREVRKNSDAQFSYFFENISSDSIAVITLFNDNTAIEKTQKIFWVPRSSSTGNLLDPMMTSGEELENLFGTFSEDYYIVYYRNRYSEAIDIYAVILDQNDSVVSVRKSLGVNSGNHRTISGLTSLDESSIEEVGLFEDSTPSENNTEKTSKIKSDDLTKNRDLQMPDSSGTILVSVDDTATSETITPDKTIKIKIGKNIYKIPIIQE